MPKMAVKVKVIQKIFDFNIIIYFIKLIIIFTMPSTIHTDNITSVNTPDSIHSDASQNKMSSIEIITYNLISPTRNTYSDP